jgi:hypothetical protein
LPKEATIPAILITRILRGEGAGGEGSVLPVLVYTIQDGRFPAASAEEACEYVVVVALLSEKPKI